MVKIEIEMNPSQFFEKSISTFKNNRTLQMFSVLILLLLISKPVYSCSIPVIGGIAYGHMRRRTVLPIGVSATVDGDAGTVVVTEGAVH